MALFPITGQSFTHYLRRGLIFINTGIFIRTFRHNTLRQNQYLSDILLLYVVTHGILRYQKELNRMFLYKVQQRLRTGKNTYFKGNVFLSAQIFHEMIGILNLQITDCKNISFFSHIISPFNISSNTLQKTGTVKWIFSGCFPGARYGGNVFVIST